jgi:superfamily II DNA or RNA helicase
MITKDKIQEEGIKLAEQHKNIVFEWATGLGKSLLAIKIIEKLGGNWNIVIAETVHEANWKEEFIKYKKKKLLARVNFFCYASLHKHTGGENYIFDEVHHCFSSKRLGLLRDIKNNKLKRFIGLSATLTKSQKESLSEILANYHTQKLSLSWGIDNGLLPEPVVHFIGITLDNIHKDEHFYYNKAKFKICTQQEKYNLMSERVDWLKDRYMQTRNEFHKISWLKYANDRKKFLSNCKTQHVRALLDGIQARLICFTGSIEQSESLSKGLSIHSKMPKKQREQLISDFNNGDIDRIFATGMLKEGVNLENIEMGIIVQLDNVERYFTQVHGRTLRSLFPTQYVFYVKRTQDEVYVNTAIENFNKEYVNFTTLDNLLYEQTT